MHGGQAARQAKGEFVRWLVGGLFRILLLRHPLLSRELLVSLGQPGDLGTAARTAE